MSLDSPDNTTVDCTALTNSGYWTMCTCYTCIVIHQAIAVQSQLCAPFIDRSHAASHLCIVERLLDFVVVAVIV